MPRGDVEAMREYAVPYPSPAEQQKIADCLTSLDEMIAAQGRNVEALKAHKKGLMQQLFPREGETLPRLRFPEFRDGPEWKPTTLEEVSEVNPKRDCVLDETPISFVPMSAVSEDGYLSNPQVKKFFEVKKGYTFFKDRDIIFAKITPCFENGKAALLSGLMNGIGLGSTEFHVVRSKASCSPEFLFAYLNSEAFRRRGEAAMTGSGGQQRVPTEFFKQYPLCVPDPPEQQRIAGCLSALDARIAAEGDKHAALKTHKRGLMQQLFPSPEDG